MTLDPERRGDPKRELAETLKELRLRAGLTGDRLARRYPNLLPTFGSSAPGPAVLNEVFY
ncbi:hypothetical protein [Streptomyces sp. 8K308]|uniref:hypothetical protein n=1 Tax=Streptomyces sp. 8K308 TaxID=2530388 RepID=UPI001A9FC44F|nr:hypothetical protein [Streptomyces sp. 8K308]